MIFHSFYAQIITEVAEIIFCFCLGFFCCAVYYGLQKKKKEDERLWFHDAKQGEMAVRHWKKNISQ